jgi:hypothetical protein
MVKQKDRSSLRANEGFYLYFVNMAALLLIVANELYIWEIQTVKFQPPAVGF